MYTLLYKLQGLEEKFIKGRGQNNGELSTRPNRHRLQLK